MADAEVYTRPDGRHDWRLRTDNGRIIATSGGQGYENVADATDMLRRILAGEFADAHLTISRHPAAAAPGGIYPGTGRGTYTVGPGEAYFPLNPT